MRKSYKVLIGLTIVTALAVTYRAPVVNAAINAVKQLKVDLAAGNVPVVASSTDAGAVETAMLESGLQPSHVVKYAGFANWSGPGKTTYVPVVGILTTDVMVVTPKTAKDTELLVSSYVYSNNTAVFTLYTGEINSKSWQYTIYRAAP
jgi:hypothetical protein